MPRRKQLQGEKFVSFRATLEDQRNMQVLMAAAARYTVDVGKTQCIRDALGIAARTVRKEEYLEIHRLRTQLEASQRELQEERKARESAQKRVEALAKKRTKAGKHLANLARHLPEVRRRAAQGLEFPSGITPLDQAWASCGKSWHRVAERLEEAIG